jgi:hypothetical protein
MSSIVPVPKKAKVTELNGYRPDRLTSVIIKCFERLVKEHITCNRHRTAHCSAFNTIVSSKLIIKLGALGLNPTLCSWVLDFLTGRPQVVKVGNNTSTTLILNTGAPQRYVLRPLLYSLFTHDCMATHASNSIITCADYTTMVDLITNHDKTAYKEGVRALVEWC